MKTRVVVLGAGFGGLELTTLLSEALGDSMDLTLIDKSDSFFFGFSKLDILFGGATYEGVRTKYSKIVKPGVEFHQETVENIDPGARRVTTDVRTYDADILVVALGADYDLAATPGLVEGGNEFYTVRGAERLRDLLANFSKGHLVVGVCAMPYKCPPAPSEAALLLHDTLTGRGVREACEITLVTPLPSPVPPSPEASSALLDAFAERGIRFMPKSKIRALDPGRKVVLLEDGRELPYDLFLGVPKHRVPEAVASSGLTEDGWIPVGPADLKTRFPGVYAIGDVTEVGVPMAGTFAEGAARVAAASIIADLKGGPRPSAYDGSGSCYIEFGTNAVGRVDINFLSGPKVTSKFNAPSTSLSSDKRDFAAGRLARWFGV